MKVERNFDWSTHQPLIRAILKEFAPKFVLELGAGIFSTPLFFSLKETEILSVENDKDWVEYLQQELELPKNAKLIHHDLGHTNWGIKFSKLTPVQKTRLFEYYVLMGVQVFHKPGPRLLFVDQVACSRNLSINILAEHFDFIIYHDCEIVGRTANEYRFNGYLSNNYEHYILKSPSTWTGMFVKHEKDLGKVMFDSLLKPFLVDYCKEYGLKEEQMVLCKERL